MKIKNIREKSANDEVRRCKNRLEQAHQEVERKEQELREYIDWRCKEEQQLYDNIINTQVKQNDLDSLKHKIAVLREKDVLLEQAVEEAKQQIKVAEEELDKAREAHMKAIQAVEKFEEFTRVQDEEAKKEAERLEDLEMEEFTVRPRF
ncbi:MAG: type III secretion system stalk subunit SctO [Endozoicomonas sp.]